MSRYYLLYHQILFHNSIDDSVLDFLKKLVEYKKTIMKSTTTSYFNNTKFKLFSDKIPEWGGLIEIVDEDFSDLLASNQIYNNLLIINSCSIDYLLLSLWFSSTCHGPEKRF